MCTLRLPFLRRARIVYNRVRKLSDGLDASYFWCLPEGVAGGFVPEPDCVVGGTQWWK